MGFLIFRQCIQGTFELRFCRSGKVKFLTFHKSLMETLMVDSSPITSHPTVMVAALEHLFQRATTRRLPDKGPAQTWKAIRAENEIQKSFTEQRQGENPDQFSKTTKTCLI